MPKVPAGKFKDQCLKILDRVAETRTEITVTKRGRPIAKVVPISDALEPGKPLAGSILREEGDAFGTGETWDADRS